MNGSYRVTGLSAAIAGHLFACAMLAQAPAQTAVSGLPRIPRSPETAPRPPRISCKNNQLSISADNATLRSILVALEACTGVKIEIPAALGEERSYIQLGPGPARSVLQDLLSSTDLDYALQPSGADPEKISAILLMTRPLDNATAKDVAGAEASGGGTMSLARRAWLESRGVGRQVAAPAAEEASGTRDAAPAAPPASESSEVEPALAAGAKDGVEGGSASEPADAARAAQIPTADSKAPAPVSLDDPAATAAPAASAAVSADPAAPPASADPAVPAPDSAASRASPEDKELQNKINDMQQLFEERKKLLANPAGSSNAPPPPPS